VDDVSGMMFGDAVVGIGGPADEVKFVVFVAAAAAVVVVDGVERGDDLGDVCVLPDAAVAIIQY
jgi:hypothetical protein